MTRPCPGPRAVTSRPSWRAPPGASRTATATSSAPSTATRSRPAAPTRRRRPPSAVPGNAGDHRPPPHGDRPAEHLRHGERRDPGRGGGDRPRPCPRRGGGGRRVRRGRARARMAARGARGVRFNAVSGNGMPLEQLERAGGADRAARLARAALRPCGRDGGAGAGAAPPAGAGGDRPHGRREGGRGRGRSIPASRRCCGCWKAAPGPSSAATAPPPARPMRTCAPMARAMIAGGAGALRLGHRLAASLAHATVGGAGRRALLDACSATGRRTRRQRRAILVDNPARLYGFGRDGTLARSRRRRHGLWR